MIVISGALVLVALILLLMGIVGPELAFVYASIAVSLVSLAFLVIGIRQRRDEVLPGQETNPAPRAEPSSATAGAATVSSPIAVSPTDGPAADRARLSGDRPDEVQAVAVVPGRTEPDEQVGLEQGGTVLVVAGRPRYHVEGCRYLTDKAAQAIDVLDALEEGFTPCGVCKPDTSLAELRAQDANRPVDEHRGGVQAAAAAAVGTVDRPFYADSGDADSGDADSGDADSGDAASGDAASGAAASGDAASGDADSGDADSGDAAPDDAAADSELPHGGLANEARLDAGLPDSGPSDDTTPNRETHRPDVDRGAIPVGGPAASPTPVTSGAAPRTPVATARTAARTSTRSTTTAALGDSRSAPSTPTSSSPRLAKAVPASKATPATRASRTTPVVATPAKTGPAATPARAARAGSVVATPAKTGPAATPARAARAGSVVATPAKTGPAATSARAARAGSVVVIPDRGRFHRAECRYVRGVGGAMTISKTAASKQGYDACGVCKP